MPAYPYALTLTNPGAETGDMTGWTAQVAGFRVVTSRVHTGTYSFEGGIGSADPISYQDVALPADVLADVDADALRVEAGAWQNDWSGDADYCWIGVECRDGSGTVLASADSTAVGDANEVYMHRTLNLPVPAGTRTIRYYIKGHRVTGSGLSAHLDDLTLELQVEPDTLDLSTLAATPNLDLLLRPRGIAWELDSRDANNWGFSPAYRIIKRLDLSGNAHHFTASGARRPQRLADIGAGLGHIPGAWADGGNDVMDGGSALGYAGNPGLTVIALVHPDAARAFGDIISKDTSGNRGWRLGLDSDGHALILVPTGATTEVYRSSSEIMAAGMPSVIRGRYDGSAGELSIWINGVRDDGTLHDGAVPATIGNAGSNLRLYSNGFGNAFKGYEAVVAVFPRALTDAEAEAIETELIAAAKLYVLTPTETSPDLPAGTGAVPELQGIAINGDEAICIYTQKIERRSLVDWSLIAANTDPFNGLAGYQHIGDGEVYNGKLYTPLSSYPSAGYHGIARWDAVTLAREIVVDTVSLDVTSVAVDPGRGVLWAPDPAGGALLYQFDLDDLSLIGSVAINAATPSNQGISYGADGALWVCEGASASSVDNNGTIWRIDPDTGEVRPVWRRYNAGVHGEGLDLTEAGMVRYAESSTTSGRVHTYSLTGGVPPNAPSGLTAAGVSSSEIDLAWTPPAGATSQSIERAPDAGGSAGAYAEIDVVAGDADGYQDTTAAAGTKYWYRVRASNANGDSPYSNEASDTTPSATAPNPPTVTVEDVGPTTATVVGSAYSDPNSVAHAATEVRVDELAGDFSAPLQTILAGAVTSVPLEDLPEDTELKADIRYQNGSGEWSSRAPFAAFKTGRSANLVEIQSGLIWRDDFEDGDLAGWEGKTAGSPPLNFTNPGTFARAGSAGVNADRVLMVAGLSAEEIVFEATVTPRSGPEATLGRYGFRFGSTNPILNGQVEIWEWTPDRATAGNLRVHFDAYVEGEQNFPWRNYYTTQSETPAAAVDTPRNLKISRIRTLRWASGDRPSGVSEVRLYPLADLAAPHVAPFAIESSLINDVMTLGLFGTNANVNDYDNARAYRGYRIEVKNCPPGSRAELLDVGGNVLAAGVPAANGSAYLWCQDISFPYAGHPKIRVVNAADGALLTEIAPALGIWGGGIYDAQYAAGKGGTGGTLAGPDKPVLTFGEICSTTAELKLEAYVDPSGAAHKDSRWRVFEYGSNRSKLVFDSNWTTTEKTLRKVLGLLRGREYEADVTVRNANNLESEPSDLQGFVTAFQFATAFGEYNDGDDLETLGWQEIFVGAVSAFDVVSKEGATCGKVLRRTSQSGGDFDDDAIHATFMSTLGRAQKGRVLIHVREDGGVGHTLGGIGVRVKDSQGGGYFFRMWSKTQVRLERHFPDDRVYLTPYLAINAQVGERWWLELAIDADDAMEVRAWKYGTMRPDEPVGTAVDHTVGYETGAVDMGSLGAATNDFDEFRAAYGCEDIPENPRPPKPTITEPQIGETYQDQITIRYFLPTTSGVITATPTYDVAYSTTGLAPGTSIASATRSTAVPWNISRLPSGSYYVLVRARIGCILGDWAVVGPFTIVSAGPPPAQLDPTCLKGAPEIWSDLPAAGGVRQAWIADYTAIYDHRELEGEERLTIELPATSAAWQYVQGKAVVRLPYDNGSAEWWRIQIPQDGRDNQDAARAKIDCDSITSDLAGRRAKRQVGTSVLHDWGLYQVTPLGHAATLMAEAPPWFALGTVEPTRKITQKYAWVSVLEGMRLLAEESESEFYVTQDGYRFLGHLVTEIGSDAEIAYLRYADNLRGITRTADFSRLANRIYPRGAEVDGLSHTMAGHAWEIGSVAGNAVALLDEPIFFPDQVTNLYAGVLGTTILSRVVSCDPDTDTIVLESAAGFTAGGLVRFYADANGTELTYIDVPDSQARWRDAYEDKVERQDIPATDNVLRNAFLDSWTGDVPDDWALVGAPTVEVNVDPLYYRLGNASAHVVATADGQGLETAMTPIAPDAAHPYFSAQTSLFVKAGAVRLELLAYDANGTLVATYPPSDQKAATTVLNNWVDDLGIGGIDLKEVGATQAKLRVLADGAGAEFWLDGAMITQTSAGAPEFYPTRAANDLWRAAIREAAERSEPFLAYDIDALDLFRYDPTAFVFKKLVMGGTVVADDPLMMARARLVAIDRDYVNCAVTKVRVATQNDLLTKLLEEERERRDRLSIKPPTSTGGTPTAPPPVTPPSTDPGSGTPAGQITSFLVATDLTSSPSRHIPQWNHNNVIETAAAGRFTVRLLRRIEPLGTTVADIELVTGRDPKLEYDGTSTFPNIGSYAAAIDLAPDSAPGAVQATITYTLELYDGATKVGTYVSSQVTWVYADVSIYDLTVQLVDEGGGAYTHLLSWRHASGVSGTTHSLRIRKGGVLVEPSWNPTHEWTDTDTAALGGSWKDDPVPAPCAGGGSTTDCAWVRFDYTVELVVTATGEVVQTLSVSIEGWRLSAFLG